MTNTKPDSRQIIHENTGAYFATTILYSALELIGSKLSAPFGYISLTDPVLSTVAIMGDNVANAANNSAAWTAALAYALANDLRGIWHPGGIMPIDITPSMLGSSGLSLKGAGRLKSLFMKVGSAASSYDETDGTRTNNTHLGVNIAFPNAIFHVQGQWSEGVITDVGFISDTIDPVTLAFRSGTTLADSDVECGLVVHGMSHGGLGDIYIAGASVVGYAELYPTIVSNSIGRGGMMRIMNVKNGVSIWSRNQCLTEGIYVSRFRNVGIAISMDGGSMSNCPVEQGGHADTGHLQTDLVLAYKLHSCRQATFRDTVAEGNNGAVIETASNDGLKIENILVLDHYSDYTGALGIYVIYAANNNYTTYHVDVTYRVPGLEGGAPIGQHYDYGGTGNTNTTVNRTTFTAEWGNTNNGVL